MAEITVTELTRNALGKRSAGVALSTAASYVDLDGIDASKLVFNITSVAAGSLVFASGDEYTGGDIADLTLATTADGNYYVMCPETARVKDSDGYVNLTKSTASTGAITAYAILLP